ncbi:LTA synthase family protein [Thalassotalea sp. PS06]|uniref:LTA synthase family protein n=1 Tax=Thalassotalea sp. PS06 TaxID=2594005 RepID=UPI00116404BB|nr:LTA synthase family protein [Thalassotalea sp. PS06]QDP00357.1 LTA synthase family protein [Thalassotalea sp. PS06]
MFKERKINWFIVVLSVLLIFFPQFFGFHKSIFSLVDSTTLVLINILLIKVLLILLGRRGVYVVVLLVGVQLMWLQVSFLFYEHYKGYISIRSLFMFQEFLIAIKHFGILQLAIATTALVLVFFIVRKLSQPLHFKFSPIATSAIVAINLTLTTYTISIFSDKERISDPLNINQFQHYKFEDENPIMYLARSALFKNEHDISAEDTLLANSILQNPATRLPDKYNYSNFTELIAAYPNHVSVPVEGDPFKVVPVEARETENKLNVILIIAESLRAFEVGQNQRKQSFTPNFNRIVKESASFTNAYSTSLYTIKSEQSILCSNLDLNMEVPYSVRYGAFNGDCLPNVLTRQGYKTKFFHGNEIEFYNRGVFHPSLGFQELIDLNAMLATSPELNDEMIGWGISDKAVFRYALAELENEPEPFFAQILTVTNHKPFNWDYQDESINSLHIDNENPEYNDYVKGVTYFDLALGEFWEEFERSPLYQNTLIVITGDHGVPVYPNHLVDEIEQQDALFQTPLLFWHYGINPNRSQILTSHLDIMPTILSMLGYNKSMSVIGRPLLGEYATNVDRIVFNLGFNDYALKYGDSSCFNSPSYCDNFSGECYADERFLCRLADPEDVSKIEQSKHLMNFMKLQKFIGYPNSNLDSLTH